MQGYIDVYVKDDLIEVMGQEFLLGELSVSLMNVDNDVLKEMGRHLVNIERLAGVCREKHIFYRKILNVDDERKLEYAGDEMIKLPTYDEWVEIHKSVCRMNELLRTTKVGEVLLYPLDADLIEQFKDLEFKSEKYEFAWWWYLELLDITMGFVEDMFAVARTFRSLVTYIIPSLKKYDANHLAAAYHMMLFDERCKGMVASMDDPDKMPYTMADFMILQYVPMLKSGDSNEFCIAEYYRMDSLQAVVKTDLMRGLMKGHFPRRCENCGRYFLMTRGYHTKYCDMPSPENLKRTCNQMAFAKKRPKEKNSDNPKYQSYQRCVSRISKSCQRGSISESEKKKLLYKAEELYDTAMTSPEFTNEEFEQQLQSANLYKLCGIIPPKKGRPKNKDD